MLHSYLFKNPIYHPMAEIDVMIGLEIHVPLNTERKLFCDCPTNYYEMERPNVSTCPVCTGMPGSKPFPLNQGAIDSAIMISRLLECKIVHERIFVKRKHYDYPDLPSGYQRTSEPIGVEGNLDGIGIWEVHIEEDPGRYDLKTGNVDYNRSGVPLVEIVTAPDMKTPQDVRNFMRSLVNILKYSESTMVDVGGVMRADVNISIEGGARVEIKNINSVAGAFKAIQYEVIRQKNMMARGVAVTQETRGFNEKTLVTVSQRTKETAADYRYIPDPDIPPQLFGTDYVNSIELPETPQLRKKRLMEDFKVRDDYAQTLVRDKDMADLFEAVAPTTDPALLSMWMVRYVLGQLNYLGQELSESKLTAQNLTELVSILADGGITDLVAKDILIETMETGASPKKTVESKGLAKVSDAQQLDGAVVKAIKENPEAVADYTGGQKGALNFLMGKVMAEMGGRADSKVVLELLEAKL